MIDLALGRHRLTQLAAAAVLQLGSSQALAQQGELYGAGSFYIDGLQTGCGDAETLVTSAGSDLIYARDAFTIVINRPAFDPLPAGVRLFAYYQTCGAMFSRLRPDSQLVADALATRRGLNAGWLTAEVVEQICGTDLLTDAGWAAAPDEARCAAIRHLMTPGAP
jgi:hypothetical protein